MTSKACGSHGRAVASTVLAAGTVGIKGTIVKIVIGGCVMQRQNRVYKRCGCRDPVDGRRWATTCPHLREQGHGTWYFSLELPPSRDGGRQRIRRGSFRTQHAAEQARDYLLGVDVDPDPSVVTVGQWLDLWLQTRTNLAFSTRRMYTQNIRDYLRPYLGNVALRELTTARVQAPRKPVRCTPIYGGATPTPDTQTC